MPPDSPPSLGRSLGSVVGLGFTLLYQGDKRAQCAPGILSTVATEAKPHRGPRGACLEITP